MKMKDKLSFGSIVRIEAPLPEEVEFVNVPFEISGDRCKFEIIGINDVEGKTILTLKMTKDMVSRNSTPVDKMVFKIDRSILESRISKEELEPIHTNDFEDF